MRFRDRLVAWDDFLSTGESKLRSLVGRQLAWSVRGMETISGLADVEFSVFSQFGDDGIIQWLIHRIAGIPETFVEFGVETYWESNTRFLLVNDNWRGLVMDGSRRNVEAIRRDAISWRHDLQSRCALVTAENINQLLLDHGFAGDIGILHIDIDGNDYWVWQAITAASPAIVIVEYNGLFGAERAITIPYDPAFRIGARFANEYFGASLSAFCDLGQSKGYDFVGSNSAGNNAYFVRSDLRHGLKPLTAAEGHVMPRFGAPMVEGRPYVRGVQQLASIRGLPVVNTQTGATEEL